MNPDKKTDYKSLQKLAWGLYGLIFISLFLVMLWVGINIILDESVSSSSGVMIIMVSSYSFLILFKYIKDKFNTFNQAKAQL